MAVANSEDVKITKQNKFPLIKIVYSIPNKEIWPKSQISQPFLDFLDHLHSNCALNSGIMICNRNTVGKITCVECQICNTCFTIDPNEASRFQAQGALQFTSTPIESENEIWPINLVTSSFHSYLARHHRNCDLDSGIKICQRNKYGIITSVVCIKCNQSFTIASEEATTYETQEQLRLTIKSIEYHAGIWQKSHITQSFFEFLKRRHFNCIMDSGIKICKRNAFGIITCVECQACKTSFSTVFEIATKYQVRLVRNVESNTCDDRVFYSHEAKCRHEAVKPGDHIAWHRTYALWHHGIVTKSLPNNEPDTHCFTNICVCQCSCLPRLHSCNLIAKVEVIEHTHDQNQFKIKRSEHNLYDCMDVCRFEYCNAFPPEYTVDLAEATLDRFDRKEMNDSFHELIYDPFGGNCEHFARRCKTGLSKSGQVKDCLRECGKGVLMSLLRLISLFIWFVCDLLVDEELGGPTACGSEVTCSNTSEEKLNLLELSISVCLSIIFFLIYLLYSIYREIRKVKYPFKNHDVESGRCADCCKYDKCCYIKNCTRCWSFCCLGVFRPFYECFTGCQSCTKCCSATFGRNCKNCGLFCTNYFNIAFRVFVRELIATGLPVVSFVLFHEFTKFPELRFLRKHNVKCICGFFISVALSPISLLLGAFISSLCEILCLGCCLSCNNR